MLRSEYAEARADIVNVELEALEQWHEANRLKRLAEQCSVAEEQCQEWREMYRTDARALAAAKEELRVHDNFGYAETTDEEWIQ